ncbi:Protein of unknown function [Chitinophaga eiseniae]|uniref:DUF3307 domain-containing protein n=1 Tax=Chitinophaga eiseniae TaxID=634771 RepID=A0A1T4SNS1_9BACT|nr:DUF3307 domain-containing protein [Chitinophaga eiseniae]SKA29889.1 Protein of unknown function [Chitinophaga eiseniae]
MKEVYLMLLFVAHFLGDYTHLSRPFMLKAKATGSPVLPIALHGAVHGVLMGFITLWFYGTLPALAVFAFQAVTHMIIDILKGRLNVWFPSLRNAANIYHWYVFGFDQLLHATVIVGIYSVLI